MWGNAGFLNGCLDKISFWATALSTESVNYIMCGDLTCSESGLIASWDFYGGFVEDWGKSPDYEIGAVFKGGVCCDPQDGLGKWSTALAQRWPGEEQGGYEIINESEIHASAEFKTYPNPFKDVVNLSFRLEDQTSVSMKIMDITGKVVKDLDLGVLPSGYHTEQWYADDNNGSHVGSGLYFVVFRTSDGLNHQATLNLNR